MKIKKLIGKMNQFTCVFACIAYIALLIVLLSASFTLTSGISSAKESGYGGIQLTQGVYPNSSPVWSPDGTRIAFQSDSSGDPEIWVMDADGSNPVQLTDSPGFDVYPSWNPDGTMLTFYSARSGNGDVWIIESSLSDTGQMPDPIQLTTVMEWDGDPSWGPDGEIAFVSLRSGMRTVWLMNRDGSNQRQLLPDGRIGLSPSWDVDGKSVFFASEGMIWRVDTDGTNLEQVTDDLYFERMPEENYCPNIFTAFISPDGTRLAYHSYEQGNGDIMIMELDTGKVSRLTKSDADEAYPSWSPDGEQIAYQSRTDDSLNIWVMNLSEMDRPEKKLPGFSLFQPIIIFIALMYMRRRSGV